MPRRFSARRGAAMPRRFGREAGARRRSGFAAKTREGSLRRSLRWWWSCGAESAVPFVLDVGSQGMGLEVPLGFDEAAGHGTRGAARS